MKYRRLGDKLVVIARCEGVFGILTILYVTERRSMSAISDALWISAQTDFRYLFHLSAISRFTIPEYGC